jgi:hypothetical protein
MKRPTLQLGPVIGYRLGYKFSANSVRRDLFGGIASRMGPGLEAI